MRIFEIEEKNGRKVYPTYERWKHITTEHPEISSYLRECEETIISPTKVKQDITDSEIVQYYKFIKQKENATKYLLLIVKYLNGEGFIITAYFVKYIP